MNRPGAQPSPSPDAAASSTRGLADLARAGYAIMQQPFTHLEFEVHHLADRPGYLHDNIPIESGGMLPEQTVGTTSMAVETLVSAANGVGLVIRTNSDANVHNSRGIRHNDSAASLIIDEPTRRVFSGSALPNPIFRLESALPYEGIISVEPSPRSIKFYHSIAVRDLVREISRIAAQVARTPLLYIQSPAQLPAQSFIGQDVRDSKVTGVRRSSSLAVRFAIGMARPSASLRFELTELLTRYCSDKRFGLWLADTRIGYRTGNWFQICAHAADLSKQDRRERAASVDSRAIEACLPVTFIGPARLGSTNAIVSFLSQFDEIGIASCATSTLHDLDFIHLQLVVSGIRRSSLYDLNSRLAGHSCWQANPSDALMYICNVLATAAGGSPSHVLAGALSENAGDYRTLVGPMLGYVVPDSGKRIAVWFSWQMEGVGADSTTPVAELFRSFSDIGFGSSANAGATDTQTPNLEYLICRDVGNLIVRGRGKLSIPEADMLNLFGSGFESAAAELCVTLEQAWRAALRRSGSRGVSELAVGWHEWWLGHWASLI